MQPNLVHHYGIGRLSFGVFSFSQYVMNSDLKPNGVHGLPVIVGLFPIGKLAF